MRRILFLAAAVASLGISTHCFAQSGGGGGSGGGGTGGGGSGSSGGGNRSGGGSSGGSGSGSSNFNNISNSFNPNGSGSGSSGGGMTGGAGGGGAGGMTGGAGGAGGSRSGTTYSVSTTNFLSGSFANPLYPGRPGSTNLSASSGGGFGQPSFGTVQTTSGTTRGGAGGGTASVGRGGSTGGSTNQSGVGSRVSHTAELKFKVPAIATAQLQADLQGMVSRSSSLKNPSGVTVVVEGPIAILRGKVADDDEKRLVEGMLRLTPGVRGVRNELQVP